MRSFTILTIGCGILAVSLLGFAGPGASQSVQSDSATAVPAGPKYIGAKACKSCHAGEAKGDAHGIWEKTPHANAFNTLATDKAKAVGKELGVEEPQKSEKCLKCHVTAYGTKDDERKGSFKFEDGVQCESCHGPGEDHQKKRMKEAMKKDAEPSPVTADEIKTNRSMETCGQCHNENSPTFKPFCLKERVKKIEHFDPRKKRTKEELEKLRNTCTPDCKICAEAKKKEADGK